MQFSIFNDDMRIQDFSSREEGVIWSLAGYVNVFGVFLGPTTRIVLTWRPLPKFSIWTTIRHHNSSAYVISKKITKIEPLCCDLATGSNDTKNTAIFLLENEIRVIMMISHQMISNQKFFSELHASSSLRNLQW